MSVSSPTTIRTPTKGEGLSSLLRKAVGVLFGMSLVNAGNYAVNILFGRYLRAEVLGDVVLTTTCLLIVGAVSLAVQSATARGVAGAPVLHGAEERAIVRASKRFSYVAGTTLFVVLVAFAGPLARVFRVSSWTPFVWLAALAPLLLLQGVRRGVLQGRDRTLHLTGTFQVEMGVRLVVSWLALQLGFGLNGVCAALFLSVVASLFAGGSDGPNRAPSDSPDLRRGWLTSMMAPALVTQLSVMVFTQVDIILVKARAAPDQAGVFAVIVLLGRIVTFTSQAVSTPLVPAIVARVGRRESTLDLLAGALAAVAAVGTPLVAAALFAPVSVITTLFGSQHVAAAPFLGGYAAAMLLHAFACVLIDYAFCHGASRVNYASALLGAVKLTVSLYFIRDVRSAVLVNVLSSAALLALVFAIGLSIHRTRHQ